MIGIYKITNLINGKVYIGQSTDIEARWQRHIINAQKNEKETTILYKAIRKYGVENFSFEVLETCLEEELDFLESKYIDLYRSYILFEDAHGYNMTLGGNGSQGYKHSEETKSIMKERQKECHLRGEEHPLYGIERTEETKEKIRQGRLGKYKGENSAWFGRTHAEETKEKISRANKGNNYSSKKVICDNLEFVSAKQCAEHYKINYSTLKNWLNGTTNMPKEWFDRGLRYLVNIEDEIKVQKGHPKRERHYYAKAVICEDKVFSCIRECAEYYNVKEKNMSRWLKGERRMPQDFVDKGLKYAQRGNENE